MKQIQYTEEQIVALGGLLHDIGKLISRCNRYRETIGAKNGTHQESSKQFLVWLEEKEILKSNKILEEIVQRHHEAGLIGEAYQVKYCEDKYVRALAYIISRADNYSSKDRREEGNEGKSSYKTRALDCVLSHLTLEDKSTVNSNLHYKLKPLSHQNIWPTQFEGNTQGELEDLIYMMITDLKELEFYNFNQLFIGLNTLLQRYTWCIPADTTKKISDISLYEHLKTTSAFSQCLYRYYKHTGLDEKNVKNGDDKNTMVILAMELEGLGQYCTHITTSNKASKRLKGKVAYGTLLKQGIKESILRKLGLTEACAIWEQEEKIYLVLPNIEKEKKQAMQIVEEVNQELYSEFNGQIYINSCMIPTSGNEIQKFNNLLKYINQKLQNEMKYKWSKQLLDKPIIKSLRNSVSRCPVCDEHTITDKQTMCDQCEIEIELGTYVEKYPMIIWRFEYKKEIQPVVTLLRCLPQVEFVRDIEVSELNEDRITYINYPMQQLKYPANIQVFPSITPINPKTLETKTLEDLADEAVGVPYIGVLKCEIKDLDLLYRYGLMAEQQENTEDSTSISRLSTINTLLHTFFRGFIQHEIDKQNTKSIRFRDQGVKINWGNHSIIDANQKGLTLVGPWNELPAVAKYIRQAIDELTGKNEAVKVYVVIRLLKKKEPIKQGLDQAQNLLWRDLEDKPGVTLFDIHMEWDSLENVLKYSEYLYESMVQGILPQSFIYRLKTYANMLETYANNQDIEQLLYMSKLEYDLGRNFKLKDYQGMARERLEETLKIIRKLYFIEDLDIRRFKGRAKSLKVILNYIVYKQRGRIEMSYTNNNRYTTTNGGRPQPTKTNVDLSCFTVGLRINGKLRPELFLTEAKHIAEAIGKSGETRSQLRAFFAECKGIEYKMSNQTEFEHHASDIWMLKAKVAYKYRNGARDRKLQNVLHDLISQGVEYVYKENTYESFKDFMKLFEAVVGYSYNEDIKGVVTETNV